MPNKTTTFLAAFVLVILLGIVTVPALDVYADHTPVAINMGIGSGTPGCEETNECYIPYNQGAEAGGTVTWYNDDTAAHTVTSGTPDGGPDGLFDSSLLMSGSSFSYTFENGGTYSYFCIVHPWREGIVHVDESDTPLVETTSIPAWVKSIFVSYAGGHLSDAELIDAIEFLIGAGIINVGYTAQN